MAKSKISKFDKFDKLRNDQSWLELKALSKVKVFMLPYSTWTFEFYGVESGVIGYKIIMIITLGKQR